MRWRIRIDNGGKSKYSPELYEDINLAYNDIEWVLKMPNLPMTIANIKFVVEEYDVKPVVGVPFDVK